MLYAIIMWALQLSLLCIFIPCTESMPRWPILLVEVLSLDSWQRFRTEGYGSLSLPSAPGVYNQTVHCWRPVGQSCASELRRFFIGGSPELEDVTYVAKPSTFDVNCFFYHWSHCIPKKTSIVFVSNEVNISVSLPQGRLLSKFGFKTVSTGSVTLRLNVIQQSQWVFSD